MKGGTDKGEWVVTLPPLPPYRVHNVTYICYSIVPVLEGVKYVMCFLRCAIPVMRLNYMAR